MPPVRPTIQALIDDVTAARAAGPVHVPRNPNGPAVKPQVVKTYTETLEDRIAALETQVAALVAKVGG